MSSTDYTRGHRFAAVGDMARGRATFTMARAASAQVNERAVLARPPPSNPPPTPQPTQRRNRIALRRGKLRLWSSARGLKERSADHHRGEGGDQGLSRRGESQGSGAARTPRTARGAQPYPAGAGTTRLGRRTAHGLGHAPRGPRRGGHRCWRARRGRLNVTPVWKSDLETPVLSAKSEAILTDS